MSVTVTSTTLRLVSEPEWLSDLHRNGWAVVPSVISREKASQYERDIYRWVESWNMGFDHTDPSTRSIDKLHYFVRGGLTNRYGIAHEQFIWDLKQDPAVVEKFEQIYNTKQLLVSFDGANISIPVLGRDPDDKVFKPWAHVDQSPLVTGLSCVQGIINISPNGPDDGGLMVLKGSARLYSELFAAFDEPEGGWNKSDRHDHSEAQLQWLYDRGCTWEKVCAEPGDLLLWDSRTVHYGATPTANNPRLAVYCCYSPAKAADAEILTRRREAWEKKLNTSHNPITFMALNRNPPEDHPTYSAASARPLQEPVLTERGKQLVGIVPY